MTTENIEQPKRTTPIISDTFSQEVQLYKAYLDYVDKRQKRKIKNKEKYKITIKLEIIDSDSREYSEEFDSEYETEDDDDEEQRDIIKDDADCEKLFQNFFC